MLAKSGSSDAIDIERKVAYMASRLEKEIDTQPMERNVSIDVGVEKAKNRKGKNDVTSPNLQKKVSIIDSLLNGAQDSAKVEDEVYDWLQLYPEIKYYSPPEIFNDTYGMAFLNVLVKNDDWPSLTKIGCAVTVNVSTILVMRWAWNEDSKILYRTETDTNLPLTAFPKMPSEFELVRKALQVAGITSQDMETGYYEFFLILQWCLRNVEFRKEHDLDPLIPPTSIILTLPPVEDLQSELKQIVIDKLAHPFAIPLLKKIV